MSYIDRPDETAGMTRDAMIVYLSEHHPYAGDYVMGLLADAELRALVRDAIDGFDAPAPASTR